MLIEFTVGNFRSFHEPITFSMVAAPLVSVNKKLDEDNVVKISDDLSLLASAAIYGANASGKSNLLKAMSAMNRLVRQSATKLEDGDILPMIQPFRLSTQSEGEPTLFQMVFLLKGKQFRYGFRVDEKRVVSEWLFMTRTTKETQLFLRENGHIKVNERSFREGKGLEDKTRANALFLSVVAQFNGRIAKEVTSWFRCSNIVSGLADNQHIGYTLHCIESGNNKSEVEELIRSLDVSINKFRLQRTSKTVSQDEQDIRGETSENLTTEATTEAAPKMAPVRVETFHPKYNAKGERVEDEVLSLALHASEGTRKLFAFAGPLVNTLKYGTRLIIDEMDARLHPLITCAIIKLFHSKATNPRGAQLIFVTHDTNLLSNRNFRRDQIWFAEKDSRGATHLYSLAELKVRNDALFETDYIKGRYGAIPFLGDIESIFDAFDVESGHSATNDQSHPLEVAHG